MRSSGCGRESPASGELLDDGSGLQLFELTRDLFADLPLLAPLERLVDGLEQHAEVHPATPRGPVPRLLLKERRLEVFVELFLEGQHVSALFDAGPESGQRHQWRNVDRVLNRFVQACPNPFEGDGKVAAGRLLLRDRGGRGKSGGQAQQNGKRRPCETRHNALDARRLVLARRPHAVYPVPICGFRLQPEGCGSREKTVSGKRRRQSAVD